MKTKLFFILSGLIAFFCPSLFAQTGYDDSSIRSFLDTLFVNLDKSRIPTGYLRDYAQDHIKFDDLDGALLTDSNYVSPARYAKILMAANSASVTNSTKINVDQIIQNLEGGSLFQVGIALFKYNYIRGDALTDSLITYTNGKVSDVFRNGLWVNPYGEKYLFGFTPRTWRALGSSVSFAFDSDDFISNVNSVSYSFDPGDGGGYRSVTSGQNIIASYSSYGEKELKLKAILPGNIELVSHSIMVTEAIPVVPSSMDPSDTLNVHYNGLSAIVHQKYHADGANIRPLIIAEGFDPYEINDMGVFGWRSLSDVYDDLPLSIKNNYDIFYIDWVNYQEDIRSNAGLMQEIIRRINTIKHISGSNEMNIVMGQSMGGLICQYALRSMELNDETHETSVYISHDVPYQGANVPIGACYMFMDIYHYLYSHPLENTVLQRALGDTLSILFNVYNCTSARQLMTNYVNWNYSIDNSLRLSLMQELQQMGMPQGDPGVHMENIAIINGGSINYSQYYRDGKILDLNASGSVGRLADFLLRAVASPFLPFPDLQLLISLFSGFETLHATARIQPFDGYGKEVSHLKVSYTKWFLWLPFIPFTHNLINATHYAPSSGLKYDGVFGSCYPNNDSSVLIDITGDNPFFINYHYHLFASNFNFVPLGSSLNVSDYSRNYYSNPPEPEVETPFSSYILPQTGQDHISLSDTVRTWVSNQISSSLIGPDVAFTGDNYSVVGNTDYSANYSWSSSNPSILSVNSSTGVVTVSGFGEVTLDARSYQYGKMYRKTKRVRAGLPDIYLSATFQSQNQATVELSCVYSGNESLLNQLISSGLITIDWGFLNENDTDISWTDSTSVRSYSYMLPSGDNFVYCRLRDNTSNRTGTVVSIRLNGSERYILSPDVISINPYLYTIGFQYAPLTLYLRDPNDTDYIPYGLSFDGWDIYPVSDRGRGGNEKESEPTRTGTAYSFYVFNTSWFRSHVFSIYGFPMVTPSIPFEYIPIYVYDSNDQLISSFNYPVIYKQYSSN